MASFSCTFDSFLMSTIRWPLEVALDQLVFIDSDDDGLVGPLGLLDAQNGIFMDH